MSAQYAQEVGSVEQQPDVSATWYADDRYDMDLLVGTARTMPGEVSVRPIPLKNEDIAYLDDDDSEPWLRHAQWLEAWGGGLYEVTAAGEKWQDVSSQELLTALLEARNAYALQRVDATLDEAREMIGRQSAGRPRFSRVARALARLLRIDSDS